MARYATPGCSVPSMRWSHPSSECARPAAAPERDGRGSSIALTNTASMRMHEVRKKDAGQPSYLMSAAWWAPRKLMVLSSGMRWARPHPRQTYSRSATLARHEGRLITPSIS